MNRIWRRILRNLIGAVLIVIGIIGWLLPVVPGWPFLLPGLLLVDWPGRRWLLGKLRHTQLFIKTEAWVYHRFGLRFDPDEEGPPPTEPP